MKARGSHIGFVHVGVGGGHIDEHERLGGAPQGVGHEHGQLVVTVRDVHRLAGQGADDVPQRRQGLVDGLRLLQLLPGAVALLDPARRWGLGYRVWELSARLSVWCFAFAWRI